MHVFSSLTPQNLLPVLEAFLIGVWTILNGQKARKRQDAREAALDKITEESRRKTEAKAEVTEEQIRADRWKQDAKDYEARCKYLQETIDRLAGTIEARDKELARHRTNAAEMFEMMDVPGAMETLRERWKEYKRPA